MVKTVVSAFILLMTFSGNSFASERQDIYEFAVTQTKELLNILNNNPQNISVRDQAAITAEALKQLSFSEAEARQEDKIGLPIGFNQPDLNLSTDILDQKSGETVSIETVPNDWFTGYLEKAETEIHDILKEMDAGDISSVEKYALQSQQALRYLSLMVQPPKQ